MFVYDDRWSPVMDDSIDACMHVCVFSVFPHYFIIIITVLQDYNFGAMTNHRLQNIISLKVLEPDVEHKQVHKTYLVAGVGV